MSTDLPSFQLHVRNAEPRVADLALAAALEMADPHDVRRVIDRNRAELTRYGEVSGTAPETSGPQGGRPGRAYYLNEAQALLVCMFSRTERAAEVRRQVIEVFMAWRQSRLAPPAVQPPEPTHAEHALLLAEALSRPTDDGQHLGPSDLALCAQALRAAYGRMALRALPDRPAPDPRAIILDLLREAGGSGMALGMITHACDGRRFGGQRVAPSAVVRSTLAALVQEGMAWSRKSTAPRGGPRKTTYFAA